MGREAALSRAIDRGLLGTWWQRGAGRLRRLSLVEWFWTDRRLLVYAKSPESPPTEEHDPEIRRNEVRDLEAFQQTQPWLTREQFLAESRQRLSSGLDVYTCVRDGVLLHYCWVVPHQSRGWFPYVQQHYDYPARSCVYFNAYTHPAARGQGLYGRSLRQVVADARGVHDARWVYLAVESPNLASQSVVERAGFACVDVLFDLKRFGRPQRGRQAPEAYFAKQS